MSYQLVEDLQKKAITVVQACRVLDVSRSGFYVHEAARKERRTKPVVCAASVPLKAAFAASHKAYGSRRLRTAMAERGLAMGRHRVRTLMHLLMWLGLLAGCKRGALIHDHRRRHKLTKRWLKPTWLRY